MFKHYDHIYKSNQATTLANFYDLIIVQAMVQT
jgi:hypothetical protein